MNYLSFSEHTETYRINGVFYKATMNFVTEQIFIKWNDGYLKLSSKLYDDFNGNMEEFVTAQI